MTIPLCPYHPDETTQVEDESPDGVLCLGCGFPAIRCPKDTCKTSNRMQARFCRACGTALSRPAHAARKDELLARLWESSEFEPGVPAPVPLPTVADTITVLGELAGFLLAGTRGGRVFALNAFSPSVVCAQWKVPGAVLGFTEWDDPAAGNGRGGLAPGLVVTTTHGLFHFPYIVEEPHRSLWPENDRYVAPSLALGERLVAFPEIGGRVSPVALRFAEGAEPRPLELAALPPMAGPAPFREGGCVFLAQGAALVFESGAPDIGFSVQLGLRPDLLVPPTTSQLAIFYVYEEGGRRGVARLEPAGWTSYRLTPAEHPLLQVSAVSNKAVCIGTGNDLQVLSAHDGRLHWSRARDRSEDTLAHDLFPLQRVGGHLVFCSSGRDERLAVEVVPLDDTRFVPRQVMRPGTLDLPPLVVPGGVVTAGAGELQVLRPGR